MIRIRYLTMLMLLIGSISAWAQDDDSFNPSSPAEPGPSGGVPMLSLVADPVDGGTVTGAGWYSEGAQLTLRAYARTNFVFDHWENADGETVSTTSQFQYTKKANDETLKACFRFSPGSPAEPVEIAQLVYHQLTVKTEDGGSVSGGGKYLPNTRVYLSSYANTGYKFLGWYDENGTQVASTPSFYYVTTAEPVTLDARFVFVPGSPGEPTTPVFDTTPRHIVTTAVSDGGTVSPASTTLKEGSTVTLKATANTGYVFDGWYVGEELYNSSSSFTYTMGDADISLEARFTFRPTSPVEPSKPTTNKYAFYLMNKVAKPGTTVRFPIYLTSLDILTDITFQLTFPEGITPDLTSMEMSDKAIGYTVSCNSLGENVYAFTMTGGTVPDGNTPILIIDVPIPSNIATAQNYQVKINQVSVTEEDGTVVTASTRNGRISVYKKGDANGDDTVDALDASLILQYVAHKFGDENEDFKKEAADTNDGEEVDALDASLVLQHAAKKIDLNEIDETE